MKVTEKYRFTKHYHQRIRAEVSTAAAVAAKADPPSSTKLVFATFVAATGLPPE